MGSLPGWMPLLIDRINWGCSTSPWFVDLADENKVIERGRKIVFSLWPYIAELPLNIKSVLEALPEGMPAAAQLLNRLADNERHYQGLFVQQFRIAGLTKEEVEEAKPSDATRKLCQAMSTMCRERGYVSGIHAIVAAEFAATMYCRASLPLYERFFEKRYEPELISSGLEWVRLHAKTHTRHAIWMKRMLSDLDDSLGNEIPEAAEAVLNAVLTLWECPSESQNLDAALAH